MLYISIKFAAVSETYAIEDWHQENRSLNMGMSDLQ